MKLWNKGYELNKFIEEFTVGNDYILDKKLIYYDCIASIAHAKMLNKINILSSSELKQLIQGLNEIIDLNNTDKFEINIQDEDCHTAIENYLIKKYGETGEKIHTGRSRNDQVLTALRLYEINELNDINKLLLEFNESLDKIISKYGEIEIPGYTHMQKAMPSSISMLFGCYKDSNLDNIKLLNFTLELINQSPLGSGAGFGINEIQLNQEMTANELNFSKVMKNPIYAQLSRGKFESIIINNLSQIMFDLNKLSTDLITFSMKEFNMFTLPTKFCTGSSIMPQKRNPDVLELVRGNYHILLGEEIKIKSLISNLISGYNRDIQLTKEPVFNSSELAKKNIIIMTLVINNLIVNKKECDNLMNEELYATDKAYKLVKTGIPFREAYKIIGEEYKK